jgi:hypothetical protein
VLELISPAGLEQLFRSFAELTQEPAPDELAAMAARYGCELDLAATDTIMTRHALTF